MPLTLTFRRLLDAVFSRRPGRCGCFPCRRSRGRSDCALCMAAVVSWAWTIGLQATIPTRRGGRPVVSKGRAGGRARDGVAGGSGVRPSGSPFPERSGPSRAPLSRRKSEQSFAKLPAAGVFCGRMRSGYGAFSLWL